MSDKNRIANHLSNERSPYLQQHVYNPVDWYPWGEEAFAKARAKNKPIFLSIGYSTCHWCHVMERESFENNATADYLNKHFISIKVDREERPDVDAIYMTATQAMTGSGGWPMTCFLATDLKPFFCGTYFPPVASYGRPSFIQLLDRIEELWRTRKEDIERSAGELTKAIAEQRLEAPTNTSLEVAIESCVDYFKRSFDTAHGGFGAAPKFPRPAQYELLFRYYDTTGNEEARNMALFTLKKMAMGGMNDQIGGGFHRYSVDGHWFAPHFEKMLYDQAQLLDSYCDAFQITGDSFYSEVAASICEFALRELTHPDGGLYSALDADSEGEEGKFYVWTADEIDTILGTEMAEIFNYRYGVQPEGNWEHGNNILFRSRHTPKVAEHFSKGLSETRALLEGAGKKLLSVRTHRIAPHLDDKILTPWNGLMIGALARAGAILNKQEYIEAAVRAAAFIWNELWEKTGKQLFHRYKDGEARFPAYLESYAFLIRGYLNVYEITAEVLWLERAITLQNEQDAIFYDDVNGGYFSSREQADLIVRTKNEYDGAEPSGNSLAVENALRLFELTGNQVYEEHATATLSFFSGRLIQYPYTMPRLLSSALWQQHAPAEIVIANATEEQKKEVRELLLGSYRPRSVVAYVSKDDTSLAPFIRSLGEQSDGFTIYYCHGGVCDLPVHSVEALKELLAKG